MPGSVLWRSMSRPDVRNGRRNLHCAGGHFGSRPEATPVTPSLQHSKRQICAGNGRPRRRDRTLLRLMAPPAGANVGSPPLRKSQLPLAASYSRRMRVQGMRGTRPGDFVRVLCEGTPVLVDSGSRAGTAVAPGRSARHLHSSR